MSAAWPSREADLGPAVIAWLEDRGSDVYQEVEGHGGRADLAFRLGNLIGVVELKVSFGLDVIAQASRWTHYAHAVWVATPDRKRTRSSDLLLEVCEWKGIGLLQIREPFQRPSPEDVREKRPPRLNRRVIHEGLRDKIRPEHKAHAVAGSSAGGHWTPFKGTCRELARVVNGAPGISMKEAIASIRHHYATGSSARAHLAHWIEHGKVPGVRLERHGRAVLLYPQAILTP